MAERYTLQETLDYLLDSSENEGGLEDAEPENSEPGDYTEDNTELEEESDEEYYEEEGHTDHIFQ